MKSNAIQDILKNFNPVESSEDSGARDRAAVTIWLPRKDKDRYDRFQRMSNRQLSKMVKEVILAVLDHVEEKAS